MPQPKGKAPAKGGKGGKSKGGGDGDESKLKVANSLKLRHILCEKESKHLEALAKLNEGISFDKVATEFSEDKARQGGLLGWMTRSSMIGAFQERMFTVPVSNSQKPNWVVIKSQFGWHIVIVEDRKI